MSYAFQSSRPSIESRSSGEWMAFLKHSANGIVSVLLIAAFLLVLIPGLHLSIQKDLKFTLVIEHSTKVIDYIPKA